MGQQTAELAWRVSGLGSVGHGCRASPNYTDPLNSCGSEKAQHGSWERMCERSEPPGWGSGWLAGEGAVTESGESWRASTGERRPLLVNRSWGRTALMVVR